MSPSRERSTALLVGTGVVGSAFASLVAETDVPIEVAFVANRRGTGRSLTALPSLLQLPDREPPIAITDELLDELAARRKPVLVDATASDALADTYVRALERGIRVVTANKKPLAGPYATYERLFAHAGAPWRIGHSATVGAGLPIVETLRNLVRTGDRLRSVDCALSGTLGFLANAIDDGIPFGDALETARVRGYTEPNPRDDLSGIDVARKLVIVARAIGARLELADVQLEPFVDPRSPLDSALDASLASKARVAKARDEKLVYLARIFVDANGGLVAKAGPTYVPRSHPAASAAPSAALAAITTERHASVPLVISGSGAGGAVTAAALASDILRGADYEIG